MSNKPKTPTRSGRHLVGLAGLLLAVSAQAHHGFDGRYDLSEPLWIEGQVTQVHFGHPHAVVTLRTDADLKLPLPLPDLGPTASFIDPAALAVKPDTRGQLIRIELPPTAPYFTLGSSVKVGDRISIVALRNCGKPHQLNGQWLRPAAGNPVARSAAMSYMVKKC